MTYSWLLFIRLVIPVRPNNSPAPIAADKIHKCLRSLFIIEQHCLLFDGLVKLRWNNPIGAAYVAAGTAGGSIRGIDKLRKCHEPQLRCAGMNKLIGLADILTAHNFVLQLFGKPQGFQSLLGRLAVRCKARIGQRQMSKLSRLQHLALRIYQISLGTPQDQLPLRISKTRTAFNSSVILQTLRRFFISCEERIKRCTVDNLRVMRTG